MKSQFRFPKVSLTKNQEFLGFWSRVIAAWIDSLLWSLPTLWALSRWVGSTSVAEFAVKFTTDLALIFLPIAVLRNLIQAVLISNWGFSPGKWLIGGQVYDQSTGKFPSLLRSVVREMIVKPVNSLVMNLPYLLVLFEPKHRGIHDLIAGTVVRRTTPNRLWLASGVCLLLFAILLWAMYGIILTARENTMLWQEVMGFWQ